MEKVCFYCNKLLSEGKCVEVGKGIDGLIKASEHRKDEMLDKFKSIKEKQTTIRMHVECR